MHYAHSLPNRSPREWEPLLTHLHQVGELAADNAAAYGADELARIAGLLHDLGKAKPEFQRYISESGAPHAPHAGEGALHAERRYVGLAGRMVAFCIAGHHAGLANGQTEGGATSPLAVRLTQAQDVPLPAGLVVPDRVTRVPGPMQTPCDSHDKPFALSFLIRMLFSALVDADFIATERFYARANGEQVERGWCGTLANLKERLDECLAGFEGKTGDVNALRAEVLAACRTKAQESPGLFSLTVPTGGGKTLSALAFALEHAMAHGLRRIIYVAPYTSVIEQTADVFRRTLRDDDAVLEHHSNFDWEGAGDGADEEGRDGLRKLQRAAQNWDRPLVVTTAVQFFESLFANRSSRCRKLHNIARSVVILDEAQSLPLRLLRPCLAAIRELARGYGCSLVLCTATQPAVRAEDGFLAEERLRGVREIAPQPERLYARLKRVRAEDIGTLDDDSLTRRLVAERSALCIVNKRRHARALYESLPVGSRYHLSTFMTADHRRAKLTHIRARLDSGEPVHLVSTSLIEAGVDIDFPVVYRAVAGVDSVAQAAGRCNRENRLGDEGGRVYVFEPASPHHTPPRDVKQLAEVARTVFREHPEDLLSLSAVRAYFNEVYWRRGADELDSVQVGPSKGVMRAVRETRGPGNRPDFSFASIAEAFRIIEDSMAPLIVPVVGDMRYGAAPTVLNELQFALRPSGACRRALQRASVQVPPRVLTALIAAGAAEVIRPREFGNQFVVLRNADLYSPDAGLNWEDPISRRVDGLIL
jgi:CRISPR-associated endonuclease/helicase Cas3